MAKQSEGVDLGSQHNDKSPLLKDPPSSSALEQIVTIQSTTNVSSSSPNVASIVLHGNPDSPSALQNEVVFTRPCCNILTAEEIPSRNFSTNPSSGGEPSSNASISSSKPWNLNANQYATRQRTSPLNSGLWISIEFTITLGQIIASIVVLSLSDLDDLLSVLSVWIIGYATGCSATLPLLYWRYTHQYVFLRDQDLLAPPVTSPPTPISVVRPNSYVSLAPPSQDGALQVDNIGSYFNANRFRLLIEKFKIGVDCFFAIWFVIGNVWVFGPHSSAHEEPILYRLCVVFLSISCVGYTMPFILCATICCCLPCIVAILGFQEDPHQSRGASADTIASLPTYNFKAKSVLHIISSDNIVQGNIDHKPDGNESNGEGGFVAQGTENERLVAADDALCCICLGKYKDNVELRELPCSHHFHINCVDKWLKINASCPLCKLELGGSTSENTHEPTPTSLESIGEPAINPL